MKKKIHPEYTKEASIKCACGSEMILGSTNKSMDIEVCSSCHPFYTGEKRGAVRGGRIERFQSQLKKKEDIEKNKK